MPRRAEIHESLDSIIIFNDIAETTGVGCEEFTSIDLVANRPTTIITSGARAKNPTWEFRWVIVLAKTTKELDAASVNPGVQAMLTSKLKDQIQKPILEALSLIAWPMLRRT